MKKCFYYNDTIEDLDIDGVDMEDNYLFDNEKYLKCSYKHLSVFTAGDYMDPTSSDNDTKNNSETSKMKWYYILLIVILIIIVLIVIIFIFLHCRKTNKSGDIEKTLPTNDEALIES